MDINYLNSISALDIKKVSVKSCKKFFNNKKTSDGIEDNKNAYNADIITSGSYNNNNDEYYYTCYAKDNKTLNKNNFKKDGVYNLVKEYDMTPYGIHIFKNKIFYSFDKNQNILLVYGQKQLPFKIVKVKENISIREEKKYIINLLIIKKDFIFQIRIKTNNENYSSLLYNIFNCYLISTN
ncbi:hypothetical protein [Anaerofustis stercorihominis]|uniref:hypothetical protein n=1 Tax=Anaerofustis stercorihominis TaxID=214853 RepID=UPI002671F101|nr:hypothetical protein [Anaerofustis stercorihominis]